MTTARAVLKRDTVSGEALFILKNLRDNSKQGRSNKLADVKTALEPAVCLEFDAYFFFLRKFHYIAMDREAQLKLTDSGERVVDGDDLDRFSGEVGEFFSEQLAPVDEPMTDGSLPFETDAQHRRPLRGDRRRDPSSPSRFRCCSPSDSPRSRQRRRRRRGWPLHPGRVHRRWSTRLGAPGQARRARH